MNFSRHGKNLDTIAFCMDILNLLLRKMFNIEIIINEIFEIFLD